MRDIKTIRALSCQTKNESSLPIPLIFLAPTPAAAKSPDLIPKWFLARRMRRMTPYAPHGAACAVCRRMRRMTPHDAV
jgi:hypothetical protein